MILLTGATGFVGQALVNELLAQGDQVKALVRQVTNVLPSSVEQLEGALQDIQSSSVIFAEVNTIVHCAARVHIMNDLVTDPLAEFRKVNTAGTLNLAKQAAEGGVKRFVFLSSIKVNGELTEGKPFSPEDDFIPTDPYGLSKYEAEQGLLALAKETGMEVVIIRSPLVYGPGVKANFSSMLHWVNKGVPLPLGLVHNKRSFVGLDNLVSFILLCMTHPKAASEVFLISDGEDVSTTELLHKVAKAFGKRTCLVPIPVNWMTLSAKLIGKEDVANRLFGSLQVDSSKARELLGWEPVITMDEQLKKTVDAYLHEKII